MERRPFQTIYWSESTHIWHISQVMRCQTLPYELSPPAESRDTCERSSRNRVEFLPRLRASGSAIARLHEALGMRWPIEIIRDPSLHPIGKNQSEDLVPMA